jgi:hypothetical protein
MIGFLVVYVDINILSSNMSKYWQRNSLRILNDWMYVITYALNMCIRKITISMQENQNLWNFDHVQWKVENYSNCKDNHTWYHDSLTIFDFIKLTSPKHIIFKNSYKLHQISYEPITDNLWMFWTFFRWSSIVWRFHQCAQYMLDDSSHF